ncbi:MAG: undecaprenyl-diphosphate phosphatase [Desulfocapsaceae bacterium]|nr:undecaprenyl-diphosphate phosphatase [Desulfocapsaceae bacterium]
MKKQKKTFRWFCSLSLGIAISINIMVMPVVVFCSEKRGEHVSSTEEIAVHPLSLRNAAILGLVEGATEYLPVSSTGHLILTENILGLADDPTAKQAANAYAIVIQAGAILAVLGLYRRRIRQMSLGLLGRDAAGKRLAWNLVIAFLPAAVVGLLFEHQIKARLFGLWPVTAAWFVGGIFLVILGRRRAQTASMDGGRSDGLSIEHFGWRQALGIGLIQCLAMWPGVSRSLATISGGLLMGAELGAAVEFSFLLGLLTLGAATVYEAYKNGIMIMANFGLIGPLLGFACAFVSAWVSIKWMVSFLQRGSLAVFGWYRIALALLVAALLLAGVGLHT